MKIGAVYPQIELRGDPEAVRRIGLATEELGYDHLLAYDHVVGAQHADREPALTGPYTEHDPFHDPFVMLAYLAGLTRRIELVTGVLVLPQRQTVLVAQQAADLDLLSGERLRLGVGVGWNYVEYDALGQPFEPRGRRLTEQVDFLRRLWSEPLLSYRGEFEFIDRGNINPRPNRQIPVWMGGFAEPAYRRAGALADGFIFGGSFERAMAARERIDVHLADAGRADAPFGLDLITMHARSVDDAVALVEQWRDSGGTHVSVCSMGMGLDSIEAHVDFLAQVRSRV